jgi:hypothetical protein
VRPEPVLLSAQDKKKGQGFDKLGPNGMSPKWVL